jgi:subtilisin family serine protease
MNKLLALGTALALVGLIVALGPRLQREAEYWNMGGRKWASTELKEYGKDPGLGVRALQQAGFTGKGVAVAYIDQPISTDHPAFADADIRYGIMQPAAEGMDEAGMHGPAVVSLLVGTEIGVAPGCTLYYVAHAGGHDQTSHARALLQVIDLNRGLPPGQKIRVVGFSDSPDPRDPGIEAFLVAIAKAEEAGIIVFHTAMDDFPVAMLTINAYADKDNPANYRADPRTPSDIPATRPLLWIPTGGRTAATEDPSGGLIYWKMGGMSWGIPYLVGTVALGLQADPTLTRAEIMQYLMETGYPFGAGKIINPAGFVERVQQRRGL